MLCVLWSCAAFRRRRADGATDDAAEDIYIYTAAEDECALEGDLNFLTL